MTSGIHVGKQMILIDSKNSINMDAYCKDKFLSMHLVNSLYNPRNCCPESRKLHSILDKHEKEIMQEYSMYSNMDKWSIELLELYCRLFLNEFSYKKLIVLLCVVRYNMKSLKEKREDEKARKLLCKTTELLNTLPQIEWNKCFKRFDDPVQYCKMILLGSLLGLVLVYSVKSS